MVEEKKGAQRTAGEETIFGEDGNGVDEENADCKIALAVKKSSVFWTALRGESMLLKTELMDEILRLQV